MIEAKGQNGSIEFTGEKIIIKRKGLNAFFTQGLKGNKEIFIKQISSIQFKEAGMFTNGYIQFAFLGGKETKGGLLDAVKDENTVMFTKKQMPAFSELKKSIEAAIVKSNNPITSNSSSSLDELEKLASLKDKGIISEDEFLMKKKQLLGL